MDIGQKIKVLRKDHNLTQLEFAKKLGKKQPHIASWEGGEKIPSLPILKKIAMLFNVSLDLLVLDQQDFNLLKMKDKALLTKLKTLDLMSEKEKATVITLIDSLSEKSK
ncbi:MAG: hypothetical protein ACD_79C00279G0002 [uncultured bacterium]|nr:MAG: hypothetical protein ACD_79C00279G0002 [uncultured bacterium]